MERRPETFFFVPLPRLRCVLCLTESDGEQVTAPSSQWLTDTFHMFPPRLWVEISRHGSGRAALRACWSSHCCRVTFEGNILPLWRHFTTLKNNDSGVSDFWKIGCNWKYLFSIVFFPQYWQKLQYSASDSGVALLILIRFRQMCVCLCSCPSYIVSTRICLLGKLGLFLLFQS